MQVNSKTRKFSNKRPGTEFAKSLTKMTLKLFNHPLKVEQSGAIQWTLGRNNIQISWQT